MLTQEQIAERLTGLGGSDAPVVLGVYPWKDPLYLYHEKRGEIKPEEMLPIEFGRAPAEWGNLLEEKVAEKYASVTGFRVIRDAKTHRSKTHPFMLGHVDRRVQKAGDKRGLEVKVTSLFQNWGKGSRDVPEYVYAQCQHYIHVLELDQMDVACLLGGNEYRSYELPRDDEFIRLLVDQEEEFWDRVEAGVPPEPHWHSQSVSDLLKLLYPGTDGSVVTLPESAQDWLRVMDEAKEQVKLYGDVVTGAKNHLLAMMGESSVGILPDGTGFTRKEVQRAAYTVEPSSYIDFRHTKKLPKAVTE